MHVDIIFQLIIDIAENFAVMTTVILLFLLRFSLGGRPNKWGLRFLEMALFSLLAVTAAIPAWESSGLLNLSLIPVFLAALNINLQEAALTALWSTAIMLPLATSSFSFWVIPEAVIAVLGIIILQRFSDNQRKKGILFLICAIYFTIYYYGMFLAPSFPILANIPLPVSYMAVFLSLVNFAGILILNQIVVYLKNHRQLTAQVAQAEEKYRSLVENSLVGIYIIQDNKLVYVNPGLTAITGLSSHELLSIDNVYDYVHPDDLPKVQENIKAMSSGKSERLSYELRLTDGSRYVDVAVFSNYATLDGKVSIIGSMIDITARREAEAKLRRKTERLQGILAAIPDVVTVIDNNGVLREILSHREALSPLAAKPVLGQSIYDITTEPLAGQIMQNIYAALHSEHVVSYSFTFDTLDSRIWNIHLSAINSQEVLATIRDITKNKQIQENYRLSMEKYQSLFNSSNDAIFVFPALRSKTTTFLEVNDAACQILGYSREALLTLTIYDITEISSMKLATKEWDKLLHTGHSLFEVELIAKNGSHISAEMNSHLFNLWDSPKVITIARDITARKQIEMALRESEARFRYLARHIPLMLWMEDQDGNCIFTNKKWQEFAGAIYEEGSKLDWSSYVHFSDKQLIESTLKSAIERRIPFSYEYRMLRNDGEYRWVQAVGIPRLNSDNSFAGYIGCCLDIHDKKQAENVLTNSYRRLEKDVEAQSRQLANSNAKLAQEIFTRRAMEKRYRKLFDSVQDAIFVWKITSDKQPGCIIEVNDVACQWLNYTRDELLSMTLLSIMPSQDSSGILNRMEKLLSSRQAIFEFDYLTKDNRHVPAEVNAHLFSLNGELVGLCIARDISDRKQAELELLIARNRINKADKLAFLGNMAAGIAHEINQPLNSIKVTADSILKWSKEGQSYQTSEFLEDVQTISEQATRIANIIKYIRELIRSHQQTTSQRFNFTQAINNAVNMLTPQLKAAKVSLSLNLVEKPLEVVGSLTHMEHVILNLINNALESLEASQQASKEITIQAYLADRVIVLISDNGLGIPDAIKPKLFTPFFTTKGSGMGLGLSIVKSVVTSHGGQITVSNNEAGGATFRLTFPLIEDNLDDTLTDSTPASEALTDEQLA